MPSELTKLVKFKFQRVGSGRLDFGFIMKRVKVVRQDLIVETGFMDKILN